MHLGDARKEHFVVAYGLCSLGEGTKGILGIRGENGGFKMIGEGTTMGK